MIFTNHQCNLRRITHSSHVCVFGLALAGTTAGLANNLSEVQMDWFRVLIALGAGKSTIEGGGDHVEWSSLLGALLFVSNQIIQQ